MIFNFTMIQHTQKLTGVISSDIKVNRFSPAFSLRSPKYTFSKYIFYNESTLRTKTIIIEGCKAHAQRLTFLKPTSTNI